MNLFAFELSKITEAVTEEMTFEYDNEQQIGIWQSNASAEACISGHTCRNTMWNTPQVTGQYCSKFTARGCELHDNAMDNFADWTSQSDGPCPGGSCS